MSSGRPRSIPIAWPTRDSARHACSALVSFRSRPPCAESDRTIEHAWRIGEAAVSAISFWEIVLLRAKGRLTLLEDIGAWRRRLFREGLTEVLVDGESGIRAAELVNFHKDPADRLIVATALNGHQLVTADQRVLDWPGPLSRLRADD